MKEAAAGIEEEAITSAKEAASSKSEAVAGGTLAELAKERTRLGHPGVHQPWQSEEGGPSGGDSLMEKLKALSNLTTGDEADEGNC